MRTNIVLEDELMQEAMSYSQARSKRALVEEALQTYVIVRRNEELRANYREELAKVRKRCAGITLRTPSHELIKNDRERAS